MKHHANNEQMTICMKHETLLSEKILKNNCKLSSAYWNNIIQPQDKRACFIISQ